MEYRDCFYITRFELLGHKVLGNISLDFSNDDLGLVNKSHLYTTVIIGENGIGKSFLLSAIAEVFGFLYDLKNKIPTKTVGYRFNIEYCLNEIYYNAFNFYTDNFGNTNKVDLSLRSGRHNIIIDALKLPSCVVATTMTITDKFKAKSNNFYCYRGLRNEMSPNTTGTKTLVRKTVKGIIEAFERKDNFKDELKTLLRNLGLQPRLELYYNLRYKDKLFEYGLTEDGMRTLLKNPSLLSPDRKSEIWGSSSFPKVAADRYDPQTISSYLKKLYNEERKRDQYIAFYDILTPDGIYNLRQDAEALFLLSKLDLLTFPKLKIYKKQVDSSYEYTESSSGETQLLCQFINIMATIRPNSLIIIDEPENSCHPDWQMKYIGWLQSIFKKYKDCHFVIATHSPLLLCNLKKDRSKIIRLQRDDEYDIVDASTGESCYSWTIEEILSDTMNFRNIRTKEYQSIISALDSALDKGDAEAAKKAYGQLLPLLNPRNELIDILKLQMLGIRYDKNK